MRILSKDHFVILLQEAGIHKSFLEEFDLDDWSVEQAAIEFRLDGLFDQDHTEGYGWDFWRSWGCLVPGLEAFFRQHGYVQTYNDGDEDDALAIWTHKEPEYAKS